MVVKRKVSNRNYVFAALITFAIFAIGMLLGIVIEGKRVNVMQQIYNDQKIEFASSQLQFEYLGQLTTKESCPAIYDLFSKNTIALGIAQERLLTFQKDSTMNKNEFENLKRQYTVEEIRYYLFAEKAKDICGTDLVRVLYFYSDQKNCPNCQEQEFVLNYLKDKFKEKLLIFALDEKFDSEPMISILKKQYNISSYPTLIFEETKIEGFNSVDDLNNKICSSFINQDINCPAIANP